MSQITVAALQLAFTGDIDDNIRNVSELVREAASKGALMLASVIPAKAGIHAYLIIYAGHSGTVWMPACAGMTGWK